MENESEFNWLKGISFSFKNGDNTIVTWFSSVSGKEKTFVNGELVSTKRGFSKHSISEFMISGDTFKVEMKTESLFKGPYVCSLYKNEQVVQRQKIVFPRQKRLRKSIFLTWLLFSALGAVFGVCLTAYCLPYWTVFPFAVAMFVIGILLNIKKNAFTPTIEKEDV